MRPAIETIHFGDIVEKNGRTIRENNLEIPHRIPVGTLVYVKYDQWYGDGGCERVEARLWVVAHHRDCDGEPLYAIGRWRTLPTHNPLAPSLWADWVRHGFGESELTVVDVTPELLRGDGALEWPEDAPE